MESDSDETEQFTCTPPKLRKIATSEAWNLLPSKSKQRYEKQYDLFNLWKKKKKTKLISENIVFAYIVERSTKVNPTTLWSEFSMLKSTIKIKDNVNIGLFNRVVAFLKQKSSSHKPKKSKIFTRDDIIKFLIEAPDNEYLMMKVSTFFKFH